MSPGQLYVAGLGLRKIARYWSEHHVPVSYETVRAWVLAEGVTLRPEPAMLARKAP